MQLDPQNNPLFSLKAARYILPFRSIGQVDPAGLEIELRSRLGFLLKARFCPFADFQTKNRDCSLCGLVQSCLYPYLFHPDHLPAEMKKDKQPFVFSVLRNDSLQESLPEEHVQVFVFGKAIPFHRPLLESLQHALETLSEQGGEDGLCFETGTWHTVQPVWQDNEWLQVIEGYQPAGRGTNGAQLADWIASMNPPGHIQENLSRAEVVLSSPLQLFAKKSGPKAVHFETLMDAIIRRLRDLKRSYGEDTHMGALSADFYEARKEIRQTLEEPFVYDEELQTYDKTIRLHGIQGILRLEGPLDLFMPFLRAGELVGVGRRISYGLGRIKVL